MATNEQIAELRRMASEPDDTNGYTSVVLGGIIDSKSGNLDLAAASIWEEKANTYSEMVDITEAGSSRKNSQLMANAQSRAQYYYKKAVDLAPVPGTDLPTTAPIVRA